MNTHEDFKRDLRPEGPTPRSFGFVMSAAFTVVGCLPLRHGAPVRTWAIAVAALFLITALVRPALLSPLNRLWMRFGMLLHRIMLPIVMGVMFYGVITPLAAWIRRGGKDPLELRWRSDATTYWTNREPPGPSPDSMVNQF